MGDNQIKVTIKVANGSATPQPAHIHKGTCATLDPVPAYPLNNVVNGMSETVVNVGMAQLAQGQYAINVHKSAAEVSTYVSCGDITAMTMPGGTTGGSTGGQTGGTPGMPTTGNGDQTNLLLILTLLALLVMGAGLTLVRRRA
jgi:LPXTG-motif cell wall-anchored protein